jgi:hypothetical protein
MMRLSERAPRSGFSLVEILIAASIGFLAVTAALYLYRAQHRSMLRQSALSEMRMNGQYALQELHYYLKHAGLGLPSSADDLILRDGELTVRINWTKAGAPAEKISARGASRAEFLIPAGDAPLFKDKAYAMVMSGSRAIEGEILALAPAGDPGRFLLRIAGSSDDFPGNTMAYPVERLRLHHAAQGEAAERGGEFHLKPENPGRLPGLQMNTLVLAEGVESIRYRFITRSGDTLGILPTDLNDLKQSEVRVVVRSLFSNRQATGPESARDTLTARVAYSQSF